MPGLIQGESITDRTKDPATYKTNTQSNLKTIIIVAMLGIIVWGKHRNSKDAIYLRETLHIKYVEIARLPFFIDHLFQNSPE